MGLELLVSYWPNMLTILLGFSLFFINNGNLGVNLLLSLPLLGFHLIILPIIVSGCSVGLFKEFFCRESGWLLVMIPPYQVGYGLIVITAITMYKIYQKQKNQAA